MAKTRRITRNQNDDDDDASSSTSSRKRFKTFDNDGVALWSDVNHDVLFIVMMKLGVVDFVAFSLVCKSWRSLAVSNRNTFMVSKPPMKICFGPPDNKEDSYCRFEDFEGKRFKTILPHFAGRICIGSTCGYLILFGMETHDFLLVNLITRHELHFPEIPNFPSYVGIGVVTSRDCRGILVFSPSISGWVFVLLHRKLSFSIAGKQGWNNVTSTLPIADLLFFKGKIYTLHVNLTVRKLRINQNGKCEWTLLKTKNYPKPDLLDPELVSSGENLYMISLSSVPEKVLELDIGEMKWVSPEKTIREYAFFHSWPKSSAAIKPESWAGPPTQYKTYGHFLDTNKTGQCFAYYKWMWYFPHECLSVNLLDE